MMVKWRVVGVAVVVLAMLAFAGCATVNVKPVELSPARIYAEAQTAYINVWTSYHNVWLALPDTDLRKAEWLKMYHPKFLTAGTLLIAWGEKPENDQAKDAYDKAFDIVEQILINLAIKKGAQ